MFARFYCTDPMNTACRVMDVARRMGLSLETLQFERRNDAHYELNFALAEQGTARAASFVQRISLLEDRIGDLPMPDDRNLHP